MTEKLKGRITISRTINLGNYNSRRVELSKEFYLDAVHPLTAYREADAELENMLAEPRQ